VLASGFSASDGLPASAEAELKAMSDAIQSDTEKQQHKLNVLEMERKARQMELNNMATRMADEQSRFSRRQMDVIMDTGYVCSRCRSCHCYC
jgi:hypothetical protein